MPDLPTRLIEAAVHPFADNAEMKLAASRLLETLDSPDSTAESAIQRWHQIDSRRRKPLIRIALFCILAIISAIILTASIRQVIGYQKIAGWFFSDDFYGDFPKPEELIGQNLTRDQKLLLFGDSSATSRDLRAKALWDSEPDNPAYFAEYAAAYQSETGKLPPDFLATARRLDPDNAWFTYVAAAALAKNSCKDLLPAPLADGTVPPFTWEISDPAKLAAVMALLREAPGQSRCENYQSHLLQKRIPLLPQTDLLENLNSTYAINHIRVSDNIRVNMLSLAICAQSWQLGENNDIESFRLLLADSDLFLRRMLDLEAPTMLDTVVLRGTTKIMTNHLIPAAEKLGLSAEAKRLKEIQERLDKLRESAKAAALLIAGHPPGETSGTIVGSHLAGLKVAATPPPISDSDVKPGRLTEHEIIFQLGSLATWALLLVSLAAAVIYRFRSPALIRRLAARMETLLRPSDWAWLLLVGTVLPFCYFMLITRLSPLGGRDFSLTKNDLQIFPDTVVPLPLAQFLGLTMLLILCPVLVTRWRLGIRGTAFGFTREKPWLAFAAVGCAAAFIPLIGWMVRAGEKFHIHLAFALLGLAVLWLLVVVFRALLGGPARLLHSSSAARVLVPAYAVAMLLMISMIPVFKATERYWFRQDKLMRFDPAHPALFRYESAVSQQAQRELRQAMGYSQ